MQYQLHENDWYVRTARSFASFSSYDELLAGRRCRLVLRELRSYAPGARTFGDLMAAARTRSAAESRQLATISVRMVSSSAPE